MQPAGATWRTLAWDVGPVVAIALLGGFIARPYEGDSRPLAMVVALPLLVRRPWPLATLGIVSALAVLTGSHTPTPWTQAASVAVASFTVGERLTDRTRSAIVVVIVAAAIALGLVAQGADTIEALVLPFVIAIPAWLVGDVLRGRRLLAVEREAATARALADAEERVNAAAAEERRHMARELHDVVAHGVSVMVIHAGAARQVLETDAPAAQESLLTVEAAGREVMAELRRLLGVLNDDGEAAGLTPQPGLEQLEALVERVREAGLPASLEIDGTPAALSPGLDVTAYRIVQEALTNALRYAHRATTLVHVVYEPSQIRLEILDDGPTATGEVTEGSGRGLVGMEERASLVGGRLAAGPRLGGGYAVRAWLPVAPLPIEPEAS
ncbi:MAG TPA: histidine kinase [Candidatus Limnocylindrales bacterium]|jgi:signal transduction histidine kinase